MAEIPPNEVTQADLFTWYAMQAELSKLRASEMLLRKKIFGAYFPEPKEGTNTYILPDGFALKGTHVISREVDIGALEGAKPEFVKANLKVDTLVQYKPSVVISEYRTLTEEERNLFDMCLVIKPGAPGLKIEKPAAKKGKA